MRLVEGKAIRAYSATGDQFFIFENPSRAQLDAARRIHKNERTVKGWLTHDDTLYIWPSYYAHHYDVVAFLDLSARGERLEMGSKGPALCGDPAYSDHVLVMGSQALARLYGSNYQIVDIDTSMPKMMGVKDRAPETRDEVRDANRARARLDLPRLKLPAA